MTENVINITAVSLRGILEIFFNPFVSAVLIAIVIINIAVTVIHIPNNLAEELVNLSFGLKN